MIYTTYFGQLKNLPDNIYPIAICRVLPKGWQGLYDKTLAPNTEFLNRWKEIHDIDDYMKCYQAQVLDSFCVDDVIKRLYEKLPLHTKVILDLSGFDYWEHPDIHIALVCYEKEGFCHRHLIAKEFRKNGIPCREWGLKNFN